MKKLFKKVQNEIIKASIVGKNILRSNSGEGFVDSAVFSVLHCYDRITTIRTKVKNGLIKGRFKADELIKRSKVILLDQRGEGTISQAISILTAVVLGSLLLMGLYKLIGEYVLFSSLRNHDRDCYA